MGFTEIADRVWVRRHEWFDLNVTVIGGERGLLVVDTHASEVAGRDLLDAVGTLGAGEVVEVVNTHEHFDHCFGNRAFRETLGDQVPLTAHETAAAAMAAFVGREEEFPDDPDDPEPRLAEIRATRLLPADRTFSSALVLDLGDRAVEVVHPGRGHTGGDAVVRVPDVDVVVAGDLIEQSDQRGNAPGFGADCFPMEWPLTLDVVLGLTTRATRLVPGHGAVVDRDFVEQQRNDIGILAETIRDLAGRGVPVAQALPEAEWPYDPTLLADAVRRSYEHLPRSQKRLPLI